MKLDKFKCRASAAGKIAGGTIGLTSSQKKEHDDLQDRRYGADSGMEGFKPLTPAMEKKRRELEYKYEHPELPQTAKSYCDMWIKEQIYNRRNEFTSKYTDKGNIVEDNSLDFIAEQLDLGMLFKNEEFFEDDFFTGTPDALPDEIVIDAKNPWTWATFPILDSRIENSDYEFQLQVYMHLTGRKRSKLCYVLSDTPSHLIEKEAFWYSKNNGYEGLDDDVLSEFTEKMTYGDIDDKFKFKEFDIEYDEKVIDDLKKRVELCREYIEEKIKGLKL